ncbi:DsbA family protein [Azotobacter vinelandii]|uniref:DsbA family protein n=1 Tax=Azotobacter vinelandii TaxID=354 RepID=UPI000A8CCBD5|nr:thioredoxin domain-containing protein [Azotobacter vinelandii]
MAFLAGGAVILHDLDEKRLEKDIAVIPQGNVSPWIYGPPQADYTLTLYSDLECPYCKAFQSIARHWIDNTEGVNLRWHHLPLEGHGSVAVQKALLAECSGQVNGSDAFWTTIDAVFALTRSADLDWVPAWAKDAVRECMAQPETLATLQGQIESAHQAGITATPTSILTDNRTGKTVKLEGVSGPEVLDSAVDWLARE